MKRRLAHLERLFPNLAKVGYVPQSDSEPKYNCIAWAADTSDAWWWPIPNTPRFFEGIKYDWPYNLPIDKSLITFKRLFQFKRYNDCESFEFDSGYKKIAIYINPTTNECTHASRQLRNGFWTSKLGPSFDIQHSDPNSIIGYCYGEVACIMQQEFD